MISLQIEIRGVELTVKGRRERAEPDVGIMSDYLDIYSVEFPDGKTCDWDFTPDEDDRIQDAAFSGFNAD